MDRFKSDRFVSKRWSRQLQPSSRSVISSTSSAPRSDNCATLSRISACFAIPCLTLSTVFGSGQPSARDVSLLSVFHFSATDRVQRHGTPSDLFSSMR